MSNVPDHSVITFFNPGQKGPKVATQKWWRGDHTKCAPAHHDKRCVAARGWILDDSGKVIPHVVPVSVEARAMGTVSYSAPGKYPESTHSAKGWRRAEEAEGVLPTEEVAKFTVERAVRATKSNAEHAKAGREEVLKVVGDLRKRVATANGAPEKPSTKGRTDG